MNMMRSIRISEEVWEAIAERGKFGETEDDVLRRVFMIEDNASGTRSPSDARPVRRVGSRSEHFARHPMHTKVYSGEPADRLLVRFSDGGAEEQWDLPTDRSDKSRIREVMNAALRFGEENNASKGQLFAIRKALTDASYHLTK